MVHAEGNKVCDHCGADVALSARACPQCGNAMGGKKAVTILIICCVIGGIFLGGTVMIGILAAIALPNFVGAQQKAKSAAVRGNMRTVQIAAESYATDYDGMYPVKLDDAFKSYFPGGSNGGQGDSLLPGSAPRNPITAEEEWPTMGNVVDVMAARVDGGGPISKGSVEYSVIFNDKHQPTSYAIRGGDAEGQPIKGTDGKQLVLSNQ